MLKLSPFRNTIRNKLMLLLLIATILPIVTSMVISYNSTKRSITDEAYEKNARLLSLGKANLQSYMQNINQKSLAVYNSINVPRSLYYILEHNMEDEVFPNDLSDVIRNRNLLQDHLLNIYQSVKEFYQVRLHVVAQNTTYLLSNGGGKIQSDIPTGNFNLLAKKPYIEPSHPSHSYGLESRSTDPGEIVFTLHRPIFLAPSEELLAQLSIDVKLNALIELNRQVYDAGNEKFYIVDAAGNTIISSEDESAGTLSDGRWLDEIRKGDLANGYLKWEDSDFAGIVFYDRVKTPMMDWYLVKLSPYEHLYRTADGIAKINSWVGILFLTVAVLATLFISFRFTKPLLSLIGYVNQIERGNLNVDIDIRGNDEIGLLSRRFRSMMQTINNLILKEYRLELANKTNQLKALQAQVNPHFLYNALQSIGTVALQHKDQQIYSLVTSLGKMMRYNMNAGETIVELEKEFGYLQAYLDLQKQRFDTSLEIEYRMAQEARSLLVPKMILQPLVENFFKHGFKQSDEEPARLMISCDLREQILIIRVQDNGAGMTEEEMTDVNDRLTIEDSVLPGKDSGIGLSNVLSRLRLHYSESASIVLSAAEPEGLIVEVRIPFGEELKAV
ncbi:cache domain-containing sensor histidine kinase [Cohnella herbarum]|uniref:histidine kinase n=1 Tax=Cohnella herbarum TaxID=2728023 RepID=A0A7Z2VI83_9BACL|nr:histidine kinase [Cohnella herbarum]QJD83506.1 histidine kinase [Cohnella herbarum]